MIKTTGSIVLVIIFALGALAAGWGGSAVYVKNEESIKNFVGDIFNSEPPAEENDVAAGEAPAAEKDCGVGEAADPCWREALISCTPAVRKHILPQEIDSDGVATRRILGKEGSYCLVYNSDGLPKNPSYETIGDLEVNVAIPIICKVPLQTISDLKDAPPFGPNENMFGSDQLLVWAGMGTMEEGLNETGLGNIECTASEENILDANTPSKTAEPEDPKNCGIVDVDKVSELGSSQTSAAGAEKEFEPLLCFGSALISCAAGVNITYDFGNEPEDSTDEVHTIEGKSGENCLISRSGNIYREGQGKPRLSCSFNAKAPAAILKANQDVMIKAGAGQNYIKDNEKSFMGLVTSQIDIFTSQAGTVPMSFGGISVNYSATCAKK